MHDVVRYLRQKGAEILVTVIWLPAVLTAAMAGQWAVAGLVMVAGVVGVMAIGYSADRAARRRTVYGGTFDEAKNAVVYTVGMQDKTIAASLQKQAPEYVGFLCTAESEPVAQRLATTLGLVSDRTKTERCDPKDIVDIREHAAILLDWLSRNNVAPASTVVDPTGGFTTMSIGAFAEAEKRGIDTQYLLSDFDGQNKPIPGTSRAIYLSRHSA